MIVLASSIFILIFDFPRRLFLIDKTKKRLFKQNIFCQKSELKSVTSVAGMFVLDSID